ncbi:MAG: tyrosine-type recombinase/integrase [Leptothrix sp. (in: b-proteobacteria)]
MTMATITDKGMQARPTDKEQWLSQPFKRGAGVFMARITPSGERVFYFRYTDSTGKRPFLPIGPYHPKGKDGFTLAQAYAKACELSALYTSGIKDLREHLVREAELKEQQQGEELRRLEDEARAAEQERQRRLTLRDLFTRWQDVELKLRKRPDGSTIGRKDSGALILAQFERHVFPLIGDLCATDVTKADILRVTDAQMSAGKQRTAAMVFSDLRQMFHFALDRELIAADPMATLKKARIVGQMVERERILSDDEIEALAAAIPRARLNQRSERAIWLILATGVRVGELMGATWLDADHNSQELQAVAEVEGVKFGTVDPVAKTWHMPDTKNGRPHTIHLSAFAVQQFEQLHLLRESVPWVFPNAASTGPVCVKSFGKQIADRQRTEDERMSGRSKAVDALTLPGGRWTAHDLRRTAASIMASLGISGDVIDECLNHVIESRVRRTYIRNRREADQIRAFDALGLRLAELVSLSARASNVVTLRSA